MFVFVAFVAGCFDIILRIKACQTKHVFPFHNDLPKKKVYQHHVLNEVLLLP